MATSCLISLLIQCSKQTCVNSRLYKAMMTYLPYLLLEQKMTLTVFQESFQEAGCSVVVVF